ncbi:nickel pincer cofactor biosynthesis protein LarC [Anaerococcus marasmi]|uniref:nickel pincer cofactor biosynthesis protein LarC n=1 Tax=Anaerococcus marasmi TaxID=2057797 RepID=UPI000CFA4856|nr:nickel pincer cofactor biosynthesis protein LarC [Anaerococcus marasmi]
MDLYFEMYSGIAGDMTIGALLDLGASKEKLIEAIDSLGIDGYKLVFDRSLKNGIDAYNFDVILENDNHGENHDHSHEGHDHHKHEDHDHDHSHDHHHHHDHDHDHHHHSHSHVHRNISDIEKIIKGSDVLSEKVKKDALGVFDIIGEAEAKAHGIDKNEVHFHEVGAIDSIIDIVGVTVLLEDLGVENIYFSKLFEGCGMQKCAHGYMPIPVPAVANILKDSNISLNIIDDYGEHVTPTGAAIVKYFSTGEDIKEFAIKKIGLGAGNKDFEKSTNVLRVMEIENPKKKSLILAETNIDDTTGEVLGFVMDKLMEVARDSFYTPIFMKKNRPAYKLSVLCDKERIEEVEDIIFSNTTSIGIRKIEVDRSILDRQMISIEYKGLKLFFKKVYHKDSSYIYPEYQSAKDLAEKENISIKKAFEKMRLIYGEKYEN